MNYFNRIKTAVSNYTVEYDKAKKAYDNNEKEIKANYTGALFAQKYGELKTAFQELVAPMEQTAKAEVVNALVDAKQYIQKIVTQPCPAEVISTIELLKSAADVTQDECRMYFEQFKGNYTARKVLGDFIEARHGMDFFLEVWRGSANLLDGKQEPVKLEELLADLDSVEREALNCIRNYNELNAAQSGWYQVANFLSFKMLDRVETDFNTFINGFDA